MGLSACAQQVEDIDRTQPNRLRKSELTSSEWFMAQTVTEVPTTSLFTFVGETSAMERIRWEVREDVLIAYRSYPRLSGSDPGEAVEGEEYVENPVAAYPIWSHFDLQRAYNTATGEQSNVLVENTFDRPWFERDYIRVDWSRNLLVNFDFISTPANISGLSYFVPEEQGGPDALHRELDESGRMSYFDFVGKIQVEPDLWGCIFTIYGWAAEDCTSTEIKVRTSFMRAPRVREYEPLRYDDRAMSKFGLFRTERHGFDPWRGVRQTNRLMLGNRHSIWREVWRKDDKTGEPLRDETGRLVPIPMQEREPKPIVYHVSQTMPEEILETSQVVADSWDRAFREAVAAAKGIPLEQTPRMFAICHNPVREGDLPECGSPGLTVRLGDIRYNHMVWVDRYTQAGLLGYGPSGADPLTGEIVFGAAYVYGVEVDTYAQYATDLVRLLQGELDEDDLRVPDYIRDEILDRLKDDNSRPKVRAQGARPSALGRVKAPRDVSALQPAHRAKKMRDIKRHGLDQGRAGRHDQAMQRLAASGLDRHLINQELIRGKTRGKHGLPNKPVPEDVLKKLSPAQWASARHMNERQARWRYAASRNLYLTAFADDAILGLARSLQQEPDPDKIRSKIRQGVYRAVMEHEVGHTIGLRHNFQGSYDALNYFDEYWTLRKETLKLDPSIDELYTMSEPTEAQINGRMIEHAYSSIMDYGMRFNSDIQGIGKYDRAAIRFTYSSGTYDLERGPELGYVETYESPGDAKTLLQRYEDQDSLAYGQLLEAYHYTAVALAFPRVEDIGKRRLVRYEQLKDRRAKEGAQAPVEVSYMFCSDEWIGALVSCQMFDAGADPFEIVRHTTRMYRDYYAINHLQRDRAFFWSEDVLNSMYGRYFSQLTLVYQPWVFAYFYGTDDVIMDNYYQMAALSGFNLLADVLMTPSMGSYQRDAQGVYQLVSQDRDPRAELYVGYADGRPTFSEFQFESGYFFFDRIAEVGHFWDFLAALFALTDSDAMRLGVDVSADTLALSIPWYLFFEDELTQIMNGIYLKDPSMFGPRVQDGKVTRRPFTLLSVEDDQGNVVAFDPETGAEVSAQPQGSPLNMDTTFNQEFYAIMYGMAFFTANFSLNYPDQWKVFRLGAGEQVSPAAGFEIVRYDDPVTGFSYGALRDTTGRAPKSGALMLIEQANDWRQRFEQAATEEAQSEAFFKLQELVERMNIARSLYDVLGTVF